MEHRPSAVAATLQDARYLTDRTRAVYAALAAEGAAARLHARGLQSWLAPGVTGVCLDDDRPARRRVDGRCCRAARRRLRRHGPRQHRLRRRERCFRYGVSYDPDVVAECGRLLGI
jgi:hypothetical protein